MPLPVVLVAAAKRLAVSFVAQKISRTLSPQGVEVPETDEESSLMLLIALAVFVDIDRAYMSHSTLFYFGSSMSSEANQFHTAMESFVKKKSDIISQFLRGMIDDDKTGENVVPIQLKIQATLIASHLASVYSLYYDSRLMAD